MGGAASCRSTSRRRKRTALPPSALEGLLDINLATEEELMTLPGISPTLAQSITAHRRKICSFRRVEDLVLVTGLGAEHMLKLRPEITVICPQRGDGQLRPCDDFKDEALEQHEGDKR